MRKDGICQFVFNLHAEVKLEDAVSNIATVVKLTKGKASPLFVDIRGAKSITLDARKYFSGKESGDAATATALFVGGSVSRVLGNFFLRLDKPDYPISLFSSEPDAIQWLKTFIK